MRSKTFRWNDGRRTDHYEAAEVIGNEVTWFEWSHVHGNGRREVARQTLASLLLDGPPLDVPPSILVEIRELLAAAENAEAT